ncbi:MAG: DUF3999 family protein [Candidatus Paceibacterota bacterium]|jgi:hypothetical protein
MTFSKKILFVSLLAGIPAIALGAFEPQYWKFYKEISPVSGEIAKFTLDGEVFASANENMSDLRIISNTEREVPYKMSVAQGMEQTAYVPAKITNNSYSEEKSSSAVIEVPEGSVVNRLHISTGNVNFQRNVKIFGSNDGKEWSVILDNGYIYDYTDIKGGFHSQGTELSFSDSTFRFLKAEIEGDGVSPIKISGMEITKYTKEAAREVMRIPAFTSAENAAKRETSVILDFSQRGIPVNKAILETDSVNFNRTVSLYSGNKTDSWNYLGNEYVFRYRTERISSEKLTLLFPEITDRYVKIVIQNKDNEPIRITGAKAFATYREVLFQAKTGETYKLYYGSKNARTPEYDFDAYLQYLDIGKAQTVTLGAQKNNEKFATAPAPKTPESEKYSYLLPTALGISSLVLLLLVWRFLKQAPDNKM